MIENHETRIRRFLDLNQIEDDLVGHIEKIIRVDRFDRKRGNEAKTKIRAAVQILTREVAVEKKLPQSALSDMVSMIHELGRKGTRRIYLEVMEDESGVKDILSGREWLFSDDKG